MARGRAERWSQAPGPDSAVSVDRRNAGRARPAYAGAAGTRCSPEVATKMMAGSASWILRRRCLPPPDSAQSTSRDCATRHCRNPSVPGSNSLLPVRAHDDVDQVEQGLIRFSRPPCEDYAAGAPVGEGYIADARHRVLTRSGRREQSDGGSPDNRVQALTDRAHHGGVRIISTGGQPEGAPQLVGARRQPKSGPSTKVREPCPSRSGQWVGGRHRGYQGLLVENLRGQSRHVERKPSKGYVHLTGTQSRARVAQRAFPQSDGHPWVPSAEDFVSLGIQGQARAGNRTHHDRAMPGALPHLLLRPLDTLQDLLRLVEENTATVGEPDASWRSFKQQAVEFRLKLPDTPAQRRL